MDYVKEAEPKSLVSYNSRLPALYNIASMIPYRIHEIAQQLPPLIQRNPQQVEKQQNVELPEENIEKQPVGTPTQASTEAIEVIEKSATEEQKQTTDNYGIYIPDGWEHNKLN